MKVFQMFQINWALPAMLAAIMVFPCISSAAIDRVAVASVTGVPRLNGPFQITFGFYNHGNTNALNVTVTNTLPAQFTALSYAAVMGDGVTCTNYGHQIVCAFPFIPPESSGLAAVTVRSAQAGVFTNFTALSRLNQDPNRTNDFLATGIHVEPPVVRMRGFTVLETNATLPVAEIWLEGSNTLTAHVNLVTADNASLAGRSYVPLTNTVVFPPGVTTQLVNVTPHRQRVRRAAPRVLRLRHHHDERGHRSVSHLRHCDPPRR